MWILNGWLLRQHNNFSASFVFLHAAVCLDDVIDVEDLANLQTHSLNCGILKADINSGAHSAPVCMSGLMEGNLRLHPEFLFMLPNHEDQIIFSVS
jgi:hypothetical protein